MSIEEITVDYPDVLGIAEVDVLRCSIINGLDRKQRAAFGCGLGFFSAFYTAQELKLGASVSESDMAAMCAVRGFLKELGMNDIAKELE